MAKKKINLGNPIYDSHFSIFNSNQRKIRWFKANTKNTNMNPDPIQFTEMEAIILGVAHLIPDLKIYPEHAYNRILKFEDLPHHKHLKKAEFAKESNDLKFNDLGRNIKAGYTYWKDSRRIYSSRRRTGYRQQFKQYITENSKASLNYKQNRILNQPANTLGLMIIDSYMEDDNITVMDLIYGKTDYDRLKTVTEELSKYGKTPYLKEKKKDWSKFQRFVDYTYSNPLRLSHYMNNGYTYTGMTVKDNPSIRDASLKLLYTDKADEACAVRHQEIYKYQSYVTYFYYYGVIWDSLREKDLVILKGDKFKKAKDSFSELKLMDEKLNHNKWKYNNSYRRYNQHFAFHDNTIISSWKNTGLLKEPYHTGGIGSISFQERYHMQKRYMEDDSYHIKDEDKYDKAQEMLDGTANSNLNEFNLMLKNTDMSNINCTVLTTLLMARFEKYCITDPDRLFKDGGLSNEEFVLYKHLEEDMAHIIPEVSPAGIEVLLKMIKRTIAEQILSLTPALMGPGKTQVSLFSVEDSTTLQFWIVRLYFYCKRKNMLDKDFFPYFVPHLTNELGDKIESIRMDISQGKNCKYLIPIIPMTSYLFNKLDKDSLMLSFDRYMQILRPLLIKMKTEKLEVLDYCYPVISMSKYLFPDLYKSFYKDELPIFKSGLDTNVKKIVLLRIVKFLDDELISNTKHEYNPSNFRRRTMLKKLNLWDKSKHLDYSRTTLPTLSIDNKAGEVTYDIIDNGKVTKLRNISIGNKLRMLQNATDLLSNIDSKEDIHIYDKLYNIYILPVVNSLKNDDLVTQEQFTTRLDDMLKVKHSLDYMRNVNLSFLRKRKATLKKLFDAQKNTLKTVLIEDRQAQEDFFNSISDMHMSREELELEPPLSYDYKNSDNIELMEKNIKKKEDINKFNTKYGVIGLSALVSGAAVGVVANIIKKKGK